MSIKILIGVTREVDDHKVREKKLRRKESDRLRRETKTKLASIGLYIFAIAFTFGNGTSYRLARLSWEQMIEIDIQSSVNS